jgi:SAM-dependent methyltransferase
MLLGWWLPVGVELRLSPYKALSQVLQQQGSQRAGTEWNPFSRLDVVRSQGLHQAPGLSLAYTQALPRQAALTTDGDNLTSLADTTPEAAVFTEYLPAAVAFDLLEEPRVLVVEPGGGLDVLMALHHGAAGVTALVGNPLEAELLLGEFSGDVGGLFAEPRVRVAAGNPRSYLGRDGGRFDLVVVSLRDVFRPVTAGAYSLSENHLYSKEAFREYLRHLAPGGVLIVTRWVQTPPSEELRAAATVVEVLEGLGTGDPAAKLAALRTLQTITLMVKKEPFSAAEIRAVRAFAASRRIDLSYLPGLRPEETNRFFVLPEEYYFAGLQRILDSRRRRGYYREQDFDVTPTTDDRPFFFHFFKWRQVPQVLARLGQAWQPFGGAGFLVVLAFLAVSVAVSTVLILTPLAARRVDQAKTGGGRLHGWTMLVYFFGLGLGFLWLEVPLMQRFILLLDQPTYSFGVVLFAVLVFSGVGSLCSPRLGRHRSWAILLLAILALVYALGADWLLHLVLGLPIAGRVVVAILAIAPLAFLMGIPFPSGIALLEARQPALIPWAWGANGYASVVGSTAAALIALTWGFSWVMLVSGGIYMVAWLAFLLALNRWSSRQPEARSGPALD